MTPEELKAIENLTSEIKELRKVLTVFASAQYAEVRCLNCESSPSNTVVRARMRDGLAFISECIKELP